MPHLNDDFFKALGNGEPINTGWQCLLLPEDGVRLVALTQTNHTDLLFHEFLTLLESVYDEINLSFVISDHENLKFISLNFKNVCPSEIQAYLAPYDDILSEVNTSIFPADQAYAIDMSCSGLIEIEADDFEYIEPFKAALLRLNYSENNKLIGSKSPPSYRPSRKTYSVLQDMHKRYGTDEDLDPIYPYVS